MADNVNPRISAQVIAQVIDPVMESACTMACTSLTSLAPERACYCGLREHAAPRRWSWLWHVHGTISHTVLEQQAGAKVTGVARGGF